MDEQAIRIRAVIGEIASACNFVVAAAERAGLDDQAVHHCRLAVDEVCTNIIEHGYSAGQTGNIIDIICRRQSDHFVIETFDDGIPFNPLARPDPDPKAALEDRPLGGWGVFFVKKVMDEVRYNRDQGRNHLVMIKRVKPRTAALRTPGLPAQRVMMAQSHENRIWSLAPHGRIDYDQSRDLEAAIARELENGRHYLVIDMGQVDYISTSGLKVLITMWRRARDLRGDIVLAGLTPAVYEMFNLIGFDLAFAVFDSVEEAVAKHDFRRS